MDNISDTEFDTLITRAMDELPREYIENLDNVAIVQADIPTKEQRTKQGVRYGQLLLGLYEGIPQTQRGAGYQFVLPDKITLFKHSLVSISDNYETLFAHVKRTLWHEIAHHYGLSHRHIDEREKRN
jgi:predicted Zn-dependent protease with MMP-like domain